MCSRPTYDSGNSTANEIEAPHPITRYERRDRAARPLQPRSNQTLDYGGSKFWLIFIIQPWTVSAVILGAQYAEARGRASLTLPFLIAMHSGPSNSECGAISHPLGELTRRAVARV